MKKTEIPGIYKESQGILINRDSDSLRKYRERREMRKKKDVQINTLTESVERLTKDMEEIKSILKSLAAK
jgi:hypothetical protein